MANYSKNIIRTIVITSYVLLIALALAGLSALFSYLNTGADRSKMLHSEIQKTAQYTPEVTWAPAENEGRVMSKGTLEALQNDYLDAWYVRNVAYKSNTLVGLKDYYTESARHNIEAIVSQNTLDSVSIESTTLSHHPTLEFFSEDGQLAVITDRDVIEYKRVFKEGTKVLELTEKATYKIVFLFEDGFWRIRHLVREKVAPFQATNAKVNTANLSIKGVNYYPKATPWNMFGDSFHADTIARDFQIIKSAGLNSVRIFVQYDDFNKANVSKGKLKKLSCTMDIAQENDLKVVVTLFDFYGDYSVLDWTLNRAHARHIVSAIKDHDALLAWDIKNEPNLDFKSRGKDNVMAWLQTMIECVKSIDQSHPITIGWSSVESAVLLKDNVDFVTFHYYEDIELLDEKLTLLRAQIPSKPLVMGEFGISSYSGLWRPFGSSEDDQAHYYQKAQKSIAKNNLHYMSWTLYDFVDVPKEVVGRLPWRRNVQKHFGFINQRGEKKKAFEFISKE